MIQRLSKFSIICAVGVSGAFAQARCQQGFVWREAIASDYVCVTPQTRAQAARDNQTSNGDNEHQSGPDACKPGYVWREARREDHVCVTPAVRQQTWNDNASASARVAGSAPPSAPPPAPPPPPAPAPAPAPQTISLARVTPGERNVTISFSTSQATEPWVEICKRAPEANLTFNSRDIVTGRAPNGKLHKVQVALQPGTYYYVISARDAGGRVVKVSGKFGTLQRID